MELKIKYCKHIPFKGYYAITLFDWMIIRKEYEGKPISKTIYNHELIHATQSRDFIFGYFSFYLLYLLEWVIKLPSALFGYSPYMSISFEQEAYHNENDLEYLKNRKKWSWTKYIFKWSR